MRDEKRIDPFLEEIGKVWKKYPDLRFGQLIVNVIGYLDNVWWLEEHEFLKKLKDWEKKIHENKG